MRFYYIRHGEPIYNPNQLTPLGHLQARSVAKRLARVDFREIHSSTSQRAIETAQPLCELLKKEMILQDWCNESYAFNALSVAGTEKRVWGFNDSKTRKIWMEPELLALGLEWYKHPAFRGTSFETGFLEIIRASDAYLEGLGYARDEQRRCYRAVRPNNDNIALFAHGGMGGVILSHILGVPYPQFVLHSEMSHTGVTVIDFKEKDGFVIPWVHTYSNDSHLYFDDLPLNY